MNHLATFILPILLLGFVVYRRIRRTIGMQQLVPRRLRVRIWIMAIIGALALGIGALHPLVYLGDAVGLVAGGLLAFVAARNLRFEQRGGSWYYRTHVWVEAAVLVLFLGRIAFRLIESVQQGGQLQGGAEMADPLTAGALMLFVCYYVVFAVVLLRREKGLGEQGGAGAQGAATLSRGSSDRGES